MKVGKGLYGPRTADTAERLGISPSPCEKLVPFLGMHVEEEAARAYRFACSPFMAGFTELKQRAEATQDGGECGRRW